MDSLGIMLDVQEDHRLHAPKGLVAYAQVLSHVHARKQAGLTPSWIASQTSPEIEVNPVITTSRSYSTIRDPRRSVHILTVYVVCCIKSQVAYYHRIKEHERNVHINRFGRGF